MDIIARIDRLIETTTSGAVSGFVDDVLGSRALVDKKFAKFIKKASDRMLGKGQVDESAKPTLSTNESSARQASAFAYQGARVEINNLPVVVQHWVNLGEKGFVLIGQDLHGLEHKFRFSR